MAQTDSRKRVALVNITSMKGHHGCTLVNRRIEALAAEAGLAIVEKIPLYDDFSALDPDRFDLVLVNGEGTLHHATRGARRIGETAAWARAIGKPAVLINTVCEAVEAGTARNLQGFTRVYTRDRLSQAEFQRIGIDATMVADLTLSWQPEPAGPRAPDTILITDSTRPDINAELYRLAERVPTAQYLPLIARPPRIAELRHGNLSARTRFAAKRTLARVLPAGLWRDRYRNAIPDFDTFVGFLRDRGSLLVAGRFHAICLALALEIPFLAFSSNTWKVESLLADIGLKDRLLDLHSLHDIRAWDQVFIDNHAYSGEEIDAIRKFRLEALQGARNMFATIADLAL